MSVSYEMTFSPLEATASVGVTVSNTSEISYSVSEESGPNKLMELVTMLTKLHLTPNDLLQHLIKDGIANATDAMSFKRHRDASSKRSAFGVCLTTGYLRKLNNFLTEYCGGNRRFMVEEFVIWCQEQKRSQLINYMDKYFYSPVRNHYKAKKGMFHTSLHSEAHDYLFVLAEDFSRRYKGKITVSDVFRGLFFKYVESMQ